MEYESIQHSKTVERRETQGFMDLSSVSDQDRVGLDDAEDQTIGRKRTSGAPIHDYPGDKHFSSSASGKYNGSGTHAVIIQKAM